MLLEKWRIIPVYGSRVCAIIIQIAEKAIYGNHMGNLGYIFGPCGLSCSFFYSCGELLWLDVNFT